MYLSQTDSLAAQRWFTPFNTPFSTKWEKTVYPWERSDALKDIKFKSYTRPGLLGQTDSMAQNTKSLLIKSAVVASILFLAFRAFG